MYGVDYVWILSDFNVSWWNSYNCAKNHMKLSTDGIILISNYNSLPDNETTISSLVIVVIITHFILLIKSY